ncbi:MAG: nucleotidyltransferase domain-containing protein [Vicinamibacterales bacterium]
MATTLNQTFTEFLGRLEPTDKQKDDARTKHLGVRLALNEKLWLSSVFLSGSYGRSTMIRPPSDIDLFVVLDWQKYSNDYFYAPDGPSKVLERFHSILKAAYSTTSIRKDHPAVVLNFSTYGFDVVPALTRPQGGYYVLSRDRSGWVPTDPSKHAEHTTARNKATDGSFVQVVKMMKAWNRDKNYGRLRGFHLEVETGFAWPKKQNSDQLEVVGYNRHALPTVFRVMASTLNYRTHDPAGLSGEIDGYLSADQRKWTQERLLAAAAQADRAVQHERNQRTEWAIGAWRDIFGDNFPAFG